MTGINRDLGRLILPIRAGVVRSPHRLILAEFTRDILETAAQESHARFAKTAALCYFTNQLVKYATRS